MYTSKERVWGESVLGISSCWGIDGQSVSKKQFKLDNISHHYRIGTTRGNAVVERWYGGYRDVVWVENGCDLLNECVDE